MLHKFLSAAAASMAVCCCYYYCCCCCIVSPVAGRHAGFLLASHAFQRIIHSVSFPFVCWMFSPLLSLLLCLCCEMEEESSCFPFARTFEEGTHVRVYIQTQLLNSLPSETLLRHLTIRIFVIIVIMMMVSSLIAATDSRFYLFLHHHHPFFRSSDLMICSTPLVTHVLGEETGVRLVCVYVTQ